MECRGMALPICYSLLTFMTMVTVPKVMAYDTKVLVTGHELPRELENVGVQEHLGAQVNLNLSFTDETGTPVTLGKYFATDRPVLLAIVYYSCPSLCNYHLNGLTEAMKSLKLTTGRDFEMVAVSMNSAETAELAGQKKANYLRAYGRPEGTLGWHFLVGAKENIQRLADQVGFGFKWLPDKQQFAHASVAYVLTPEGKISRYLHGIQVDPKTLTLSLIEASHGKIGNAVDRVLMFCLQFDPTKNKYTLYAWNLMRLGGLFMVLLLIGWLSPWWWREITGLLKTPKVDGSGPSGVPQ